MREKNRIYSAQKPIWISIYILLALLCAPSSNATEPLPLQSGAHFYSPLNSPLARHLDVYIDNTGNIDIADIMAAPELFKPVTSRYPDFGLNQGRVWLRTTLVNPSKKTGRWRIDLNRQYYTQMDIYRVNAHGSPSRGSPEKIMQHTDQQSYNDREIPDRMLAVDITLDAGETTTIYFGYRSASTTYLPLGVGTAQAVQNRHNKESMRNWLSNGALLAIIAFALMMTPVIRWQLSLSFSLYILAGFIFVLHADGYTFEYLWPNQPIAINDPLNLSFMVLMPVFGLTFSRMLFNFKEHAPRFDTYLKIYIAAACLIALLSFQIHQVSNLLIIAYLAAPLGSFTQIVAGIIAWRRKLLGALPYLIGGSIVISSIAYAFIAHIIPGKFNLDATLDYGHLALIAECFAFAAAIVMRLSGTRKERDRALRAELVSAKDKLKLATDLRKSQDDYIHARKMADIRRNQLSSVSHDLQQPLASLRGALGKISQKKHGTDEQATEQMYAAFDYLENIARGQINTTNANNHSDKPGKNTVLSSLETFPVRTILDNVYAMFKDEAKDKGLDFRYRTIVAGMDADIISDPLPLMRAVNNLISNAIKHTETGSILLTARRRKHKGSDYIRIEIWDTGVGMTKDDIHHLSKRHNKGEHSDGSGLGLAIVTEISASLGLDFKLNSRAGKGTAAFLYVPSA